MKDEAKQYNFKIPASLLDALKTKAEEEGTSVTALITQGVRQILGITEVLPERIDNQLYERLDQIEGRLTQVEKSDIETNIYGYIYRLESQIQELKEFASDYLESKGHQATKHQNPTSEKLPLLEAIAAAAEKTDSTPAQSMSQREVEKLTKISQRQLSQLPLNTPMEVTIEGKPYRIQCTERPGERKPSRWIVKSI